MSKESFEHLCHAVLEGTADEVQLEQFRAHLRADATQRKAYLDQTQMHALLTWQQGRAAIPELALLSTTDVPPHPKIRYEEVGEDKFVYCPGKNGLGKSSTLSDDLHDEWVIGEERPWWYFRL